LRSGNHCLPGLPLLRFRARSVGDSFESPFRGSLAKSSIIFTAAGKPTPPFRKPPSCAPRFRLSSTDALRHRRRIADPRTPRRPATRRAKTLSRGREGAGIFLAGFRRNHSAKPRHLFLRRARAAGARPGRGRIAASAPTISLARWSGDFPAFRRRAGTPAHASVLVPLMASH